MIVGNYGQLIPFAESEGAFFPLCNRFMASRLVMRVRFFPALILIDTASNLGIALGPGFCII